MGIYLARKFSFVPQMKGVIMEQRLFIIEENDPITDNVYKMVLYAPPGQPPRPGQFVNVAVEGCYLRRPVSVCDGDAEHLTLIYKEVGYGTMLMSCLGREEYVDILTGLGNGYDTSLSGDRPLLIGGGVGVPPLYLLAKTLLAEGKRPTVVLGFNKRDEIFYEDEFKALGCDVTVTTVDGSYGARGFVTDALPADYTHFYTCGPEPMLKAVDYATLTDGQFSFEERMGCGFGACMGCSKKTRTGYKRVCKDGPVFRKEEILWES